MKVKAIWEFDFDTEGLDPMQTDIPGLAKDTTRYELTYLLRNRDIIADDFKYVVDDGETVKQAEWLMKTETFGCRPDKMFITHVCSHCGHPGRTNSIEVAAWEAYYKDYYNPELSKYCPDCGCEMTVLPMKGE